MEIKLIDFIRGLKYLWIGYETVVLANDRNKTIIIKNITYKEYIKIRDIEEKLLEEEPDICNSSIDLEVYNTLKMINKFIIPKFYSISTIADKLNDEGE